MKYMLILIFLTMFMTGVSQASEVIGIDGCYDVRFFGATTDGVTLDTKAIQKAVDVCALEGGGTITFPAGVYRTGTIILKDRITFHLQAGAVILGSNRLEDYPGLLPEHKSLIDTDHALIYAEGVHDIAITGRGIIDGSRDAILSGGKFKAYVIHLAECENVLIRDVTVRNSSTWSERFFACQGVTIDAVTVRTRFTEDKRNWGRDGFDIDCSSRVRIINCDIDSGGDCIALKSTSNIMCNDVVVSNCVLRSFGQAIRIGSESNGGFRNVAVTNCTIRDSFASGIDINTVDGGVLDGVIVSNIVMRDVGSVISIRLGNRARPFNSHMPRPGIGSLENVSISNIRATGVDSVGCAITGIEGYPARNIRIENVGITFIGGRTREDAAREIPERPDAYPYYKMFGILPSYGFFCRHVDDIRFRDIKLSFERPDQRPALFCDKVSDLDVFGFTAQTADNAGATIRLRDVDGAFIHGCRPCCKVAVFLTAEGEDSSGIVLSGNDFSNVKTVAERAEDVPEDAIGGTDYEEVITEIY